MAIPTKIEGKWTIKEEDLPALAKHAFDETNPLYPVPKIFSEKELIDILNLVR